jgi:hypothetical protein
MTNDLGVWTADDCAITNRPSSGKSLWGSLKGYRGVDRPGTKSVVSPIQPRDGAANIGAAGKEVMQRAGPPGQRDLVVAT